MKKYTFIVPALIFNFLFIFQSFGNDFDGLTVGIGSGYTEFNKLKTEIYFGTGVTMSNFKGEIRFGIINRPYEVDFDGIKDLKANSAGLFADVSVYPFQKFLFVGFRWEMLSINWLDSKSKKKIEDTYVYKITDIYTGTNAYLQVGTTIPIVKNFGLKLYLQPGVQSFNINSQKILLDDGSTYRVEEKHIEFVYDFNISMEYKF